MTLIERNCAQRDMYNNASDRDQVAMIHLFGIKYANEINAYSGGLEHGIRKHLNGVPETFEQVAARESVRPQDVVWTGVSPDRCNQHNLYNPRKINQGNMFSALY